MKILYYVCCDSDLGEFFFDDKFEVITYWSSNDASWRSEYMDPLLFALGFKKVSIKPKDPRVWDTVKATLMECGYSEEDLESV